MVGKNIKKVLKKKIENWCSSINDKEVVEAIKKDVLITGGVIVSLLNSEKPNDYDIYFKTKESMAIVANYYADLWNVNHPKDNGVYIEWLEDRMNINIKSQGIVSETQETGIDDETEPAVEENIEKTKKEEPAKYRPRYITSNAISLSDSVQIIIRFYGDIGQIHTNFDYVHCTCAYDYSADVLDLPARALEAIINKELYYMGSKYPLCSIIRSRKFIKRGWNINAGQYVKMCLQLNQLDLMDMGVLSDQLIGVDSAYFSKIVDYVATKKTENPNFTVDNSYLFEIINKVF